MYCSHCGSKLSEGSSFCTNCGAKIEDSSNFENKSNQGQQTDSWQQSNENSNVKYSDKSKLAAGLLGIFLGGLGIHNFYLGYTGKAVAQLILFFFCAGIVSSIWGFIEGIMILAGSIDRDAQGKKLTD